MRLKVTPCGPRANTTREAADAIIDYLMGRGRDPMQAAAKVLHRQGVDGTVEYYADTVEGDGVWLGKGAAYFGLSGTVNETHLRHVLTGRHPFTGTRLLTARGSAARVELRTGQFTSFDINGRPVYSLQDAAAVLYRQSAELVDVWEHHDMTIPRSAVTDRPDAIHVIVDGDGNEWVTEDELERAEARYGDKRGAAKRIRAGGDPDELLSMADAANVAGVTGQYLRKIAKEYDENCDAIEQTIDAEETWDRAFLRTVRKPEQAPLGLSAIPDRGTVSIDQAARIAGVTRSSVRQWISRGKLPASQTENPVEQNPVTGTLIDPVSLRSFIAARHPRIDLSMIPAEGTVSVAEAAQIAGVSAQQVRHWITDNKLGATNSPPPAAQRFGGNGYTIDVNDLRSFLESRQRPNMSAMPTDRPLSITEAVHWSGLSPRTLRRHIDTGRLPARNGTAGPHSVPRERYRIDVGDLRAFMANRPHTPKLHQARYVSRGELAGFLERRDQPVARVGYDLTLTTEKSVSVLAMLADGHVRDTIVEAIDAANRVAIDYLERNAAWTRKQSTMSDGHGGTVTVFDTVATEGLTVASFLHGTSRALDPFLHRHNVVANSTVDADGNTKTLDATHFYRHAPAAAALASARLRAELTTRLGVRFVQSPSGAWEIDGVPDQAIRVFSKRSNEIGEAFDEMVNKLGYDTTAADLRDIAAIDTRTDKIPTSIEELLAGWSTQAAAAGLDRDRINQCFGPSGHVIEQLSQTETTELHRFLDGAHGVTEKATVFTRIDVIQSVTRWRRTGTDGVPRLVVIDPAEVERAVDRYLASDSVVTLDATAEQADAAIIRSDGKTVSTRPVETFTTLKALKRQQRVLDWVHDTTPTTVGIVSPVVVEQTILNSTLSDEQAELVRAFCGTPRQARWAIGVAGAGKTFALQYARQAWETAGWKVLGTAVSARATSELSDSIAAETLARMLTLYEETGRNPLDARTVLVVDEAGTLSDIDMARLIHMATDAGAVLRFVGDPAQHGSVNAGGLFTAMCTSGDTIRVMTARRVKHDADRAAAERLRGDEHADPKTALEQLAQAGHLIVADTAKDAYTAVLARWWEHQHTETPHPMIEDTNTARIGLNLAAQRLRQLAGHVGTDTIPGAPERQFGIGDQVIARINNRDAHHPDDPKQFLVNGTPGVVTTIDPDADTITVDFARIGPITLDRNYFGISTTNDGTQRVGLELGYAVTSHGVQGATLEHSTSTLRPTSSRAAAYVNLTRGKHSNVTIITATDRDDIDLLPTADNTSLVDQVVSTLATTPNRPALAVDPDALIAHHLGTTRTIDDLAEQINNPNIDLYERRLAQRAITSKLADIARTARTDPPKHITQHLPARPETPHFQQRWDTLVGDIAAHKAISPSSRWLPDWVPWNSARSADGDRIAEQIVRLNVDLTLRAIAADTPTVETDTTLIPLDQLVTVTTDPVPAAVEHARHAAADLAFVEARFKALVGEESRLSTRKTAIEQLPRRKRGQTRAEHSQIVTRLNELGPDIREATSDVVQARQTAADANHQAANARAGLPTSPDIANREAWLRRRIATQPTPWITRHLTSVCAQHEQPAVEDLATLYARTAAYRERWNIAPDELSLTGPRPPASATGWQQREWNAISKLAAVTNKHADARNELEQARARARETAARKPISM